MRVLLNPSLKIGQRIQLQSNVTINRFEYGQDLQSQANNAWLQRSIQTSADGTYYIMRADYSGDSRGQAWYTDTLVCLAVDASIPANLATAGRHQPGRRIDSEVLIVLRAARYYDPEETLRLAMDGRQVRLWTLLPCVVATGDKLYGMNGATAQNTLDLQPTINGIYTDGLGIDHSVQMPVLLDCPISWPRGGGVVLTFPVANGDEVLALISSRCIDNWFASGNLAARPGVPRPRQSCDGPP